MVGDTGAAAEGCASHRTWKRKDRSTGRDVEGTAAEGRPIAGRRRCLSGGRGHTRVAGQGAHLIGVSLQVCNKEEPPESRRPLMWSGGIVMENGAVTANIDIVDGVPEQVGRWRRDGGEGGGAG